jgi:hypothetical protein
MTHKIVFHSRSNSVCRLIEIIKTHTTIPLNSKTSIHTTQQQGDKNSSTGSPRLVRFHLVRFHLVQSPV